MAQNVNTLESYFPVPGVSHADEILDTTVRQLSVLDTETRLIMISVSQDIVVTFDGTDPTTAGHGHAYLLGDVIHMNEVSAAAMKWTSESTGVMTVTELQRVGS